MAREVSVRAPGDPRWLDSGLFRRRDVLARRRELRHRWISGVLRSRATRSLLRCSPRRLVATAEPRRSHASDIPGASGNELRYRFEGPRLCDRAQSAGDAARTALSSRRNRGRRRRVGRAWSCPWDRPPRSRRSSRQRDAADMKPLDASASGSRPDSLVFGREGRDCGGCDGPQPPRSGGHLSSRLESLDRRRAVASTAGECCVPRVDSRAGRAHDRVPFCATIQDAPISARGDRAGGARLRRMLVDCQTTSLGPDDECVSSVR